MKKIAIVDYIGNSDEFGNPIGHPIKVIQDYYNLLEEDVEIKLIIPSNYRGKIQLKNENESIYLDYFMNMLSYSKLGKLKNIIGRILNLRNVFKDSKDCEIIWFINIDKILYLYLYIVKVKCRSDIWITQYSMIYKENGSAKDKLLKRISDRVYDRFKFILSYNKKVMETYNNILKIPDYFYNEEQFEIYKNNIKKNEVIAIGTILESKDFEGIVNEFKNININLNIVGKFHDKDRFKKLKEMAKHAENIKIEDLDLTYDKYYEMMSQYKYVILPYKKENYFQRTSGVLIEAKLIGAIPIAPKYLLEFNNINGIAYEDVEDLNSIIKNILNGNGDGILNFNEDIDIYNSKKIKKKILDEI